MLPFNRPNQPQDLQAIYFSAVRAHNAGDFATARAAYERVLAEAPDQIDTNYQMGRLLVQTNAAKDALRYLEKAVFLAPQTYEFWRILIETQSGSGMRKQARRTLRRAAANRFPLAQMDELRKLAERDPATSVTSLGNAPQDQVDRAVALFQSGNIAGAEQLVRQLTAAHPKVAFLQNLLGIIHMQKGAFRDAGECFALACELDPFFPDAFNNLGKAYLELESFADALVPLTKALELRSDYAAAHINAGSACLGVEDYQAARDHFTRALALVPDSQDCRLGRARAMLELGEHESALKEFEDLADSVSNIRDRGFAVLGAADCLGKLGRSDEKIRLLRDHADSAPEDHHAGIALAKELISRGEFDESREMLRQILSRKPDLASVYQMLGRIGKWKADDPLIAQAEDLFATDNLTGPDRVGLAFALAKAMEDLNRTDRVFEYLNVANAELRSKFVYSTRDVRADFDHVLNDFSRDFFADLADLAVDDDTPVFILGLPRSGTTLTEQIISNHPRVAGAGEVGSASTGFLYPITTDEGGFVSASDIDRNALGEAARACVDMLKERFPDSPHVTDKLPHTFVVVGFIMALLPNAKIVHVVRNAVDNCLSIYKNQFIEKSHRYSNDLRELGDYYAMYSQLMAHWSDFFPGRMIELDYDALVADPQTKSRDLIAALGLEWDDRCLDVASNKREIKTLSVYQARQPIYKTSSRGWKKYETDIGELLDALREGGVDFD